jgi:hypothetical protein
MSANKKIIGGFATLIVLGFFTLPVCGGILLDQDPGCYYQGDKATWSGSSDFQSEDNANLTGHVDWAVFKADAFPFNDDTSGPSPYGLFAPTGGELVYAYQVFDEGSDHISTEIVSIDSHADNIGAVSDTLGGLTGVEPTSMDLSSPGGSAVWLFNAIYQTQNSVGLTYCSSYTPVFCDASMTIDGGTFGMATVMVPSPTQIPEPAAIWLLITALCAFTARRLWRR